MTAQAVETCLELGIDVSYFSPAGRFLGLLRGLPTSGVDARQWAIPVVRVARRAAATRPRSHPRENSQPTSVMLMRNGDVPDRVAQLMAGFRVSSLEAKICR